MNSKDGVISDTISEDPVPNTGGMPLLAPVVSGLAFIGVGLLLFRSAVRRGTLESDAPDGAEGVQPVLPVEIPREAVESYAPYLQASGEMRDPVFGEPTRYGTPYHALCNAVLAGEDAGERKSAYADRAVRGRARPRHRPRTIRRRHTRLPGEGVVRLWCGTSPS